MDWWQDAQGWWWHTGQWYSHAPSGSAASSQQLQGYTAGSTHGPQATGRTTWKWNNNPAASAQGDVWRDITSKEFIVKFMSMVYKTTSDCERKYAQARFLQIADPEYGLHYRNLMNQYIKLQRLDEGFLDLDEQRDEYGKVTREAYTHALNSVQRKAVAWCRQQQDYRVVEWEKRQRRLEVAYRADMDRQQGLVALFVSLFDTSSESDASEAVDAGAAADASAPADADAAAGRPGLDTIPGHSAESALSSDGAGRTAAHTDSAAESALSSDGSFVKANVPYD